ncbi:MAG TPA: response regulator [Thiolapillus brandeum]|uniref:Response regulator n=1 Tax=Thiolapillus brandeum TaxID=1076588 RepID=A0A831NRT9_9GAMM|nr:response regulator [Thiolapillus brandeum]
MNSASNKRYAGFKVLIVDDNRHNLFTLRSLIKKHMDVKILEAESGRKALELARANPDIDLIILDVQMPEMDGFETARMLKLYKKTGEIPVIFLTAAFKTEEFQQKGYDVGAADYLLKPIDDNQLLNKISTYFRLIEKERDLNRILEQKVAERTAELHQANQHLENILRNMGEALLILTPEGNIKQVNPAACEMLGYDMQELKGMSIGDVFEEEGPEQANAFMGMWLEALIRAGALQDIEASFIAKNGERVPILFSRTAIVNENGEIDEIICIAKNMSGYCRVDEAESMTQRVKSHE